MRGRKDIEGVLFRSYEHILYETPMGSIHSCAFHARICSYGIADRTRASGGL